MATHDAIQTLLQVRDDMLCEVRRLENVVRGLDLAIELLEKEDEISEWTTDDNGNLSRAIGHEQNEISGSCAAIAKAEQAKE